MRMDADTYRAASCEVTTEILNPIGVNVRRIYLYGRGQVDDHRSFDAGLPDIGHRLADLQGEIRLGKAKRFGGVFIAPLCLRVCFTQRPDLARSTDRQLDNFLFALAEYQATEERRRGVIKMHRGAVCTSKRCKGAFNKIAARLSQYLNGDLLRYAVLFNQLANKLKICLRGGWESDFNLFKSAFEELLPETQLARAVHRFGQRLIPVAQIGGEPAWRMGQLFIRPLAVGQMDRLIRKVFL